MSRPLLNALRFGAHWATPRHELSVGRVRVPVEGSDESVPGHLYEPMWGHGPRRGWVILHGMTRIGLSHPSLDRFARALTSVGGRVLVPEIREWMELEFAPERAQAIIRGAVRSLATDPASLPGGVILIGVSFGGPQALVAGADPAIRPFLRGVVSWGGYGDLRRTVRFHFTGRHGWNGDRFHRRPDPYGRWIVGSNCLQHVPEHADRAELVAAIRSLAIAAGERRIDSWDPVYDPMKARLRRTLSRDDRELFDLFAPPATREPDPEPSEALADAIVAAARVHHPLLDPMAGVGKIDIPVRLLHGRDDHLIPFTETLALGAHLAPTVTDLSTDVTGLFAHSGTSGSGGIPARVKEARNLVGALSRIFEMA